MTARVMARELGLVRYRVDLSRAMSKCIGETEKNLERLLDEAQGSSPVTATSRSATSSSGWRNATGSPPSPRMRLAMFGATSDRGDPCCEVDSRRVRLDFPILEPTPVTPPRYQFGEYVLDAGTRQLLRGGREVPFPPKAFELLELLLRSRPRAVSRTRLQAAIWPDTHVGASSLHVLVSQVRAARGDDAGEPQWIRTVDRFGYAFAGAATEEGARAPSTAPSADNRPRARIVGKEHEFLLGDGVHVLGRDETAAVRADSGGVS